MDNENQNKPIPVRMKSPLRKRVGKAAKKLGVTNSDIMRLGVMLILPQIEAGTIRVPRSQG